MELRHREESESLRIEFDRDNPREAVEDADSIDGDDSASPIDRHHHITNVEDQMGHHSNGAARAPLPQKIGSRSPLEAASPIGVPHGSYESALRANDVVTMSCLVSSFSATMDEFLGVIKEFCQRNAVTYRKQEADLKKAVHGDLPHSTSSGSSLHAAEVCALEEAFRATERFAKSETLIDLCRRVDGFFMQTSCLRETAKKMALKLSNRNMMTPSLAHVGNSRFVAVGTAPSAGSTFYGGGYYGSVINAPMFMGMSATPHVSMLRHPTGSALIQSDFNVLGQHQRSGRLTTTFAPLGGAASGSASPQTTETKPLHTAQLNHTDSIASMNLSEVNPPTHAVETNVLDVSRDDDGNKLINEYVVIGALGRGSYGKVKLVEQKKSKELFAIKILNKSMLKKIRNGLMNGMQQVQTEIAVMKKLRHRNIVNLYEVIDDPQSDKMYLVMQYVEKGPVLKLDSQTGTCPVLEDRVARDYARQLAAGLNYLHRHNVVHRDIKPDNILLGSHGTVYLSDFGVAEMLDGASDEITGSQGTPAFMSPELCRGEGSVHGKAVDMWALGVTLYAFLFGKLPYYGKNMDEISQKIQNSSLEFPKDADEEWRELLCGLLNKDPNRRMTASELRQSPILFGKGEDGVAMERSRRASAFDVLVVDDEDINNAITVGKKVHLCHSCSPREKVSKYVEGIKVRVASKKDAEASVKSAGKEMESIPTIHFSSDDSSALTPRPPQSAMTGKEFSSPPARGALHDEINTPTQTKTGAQLRAASLK